jgi:hypothetical protein
VSKILRVPAATAIEGSALRLSQSPHWTGLLDCVEAQISGRQQIRGSGPSSLQGTASALARAHSRLLVALENDPNISEDTVSQLTTEAVELVLTVARVWANYGPRTEDRRRALADQLRRRLSSREDAVLAGEVTYCVWSEQAEAPAVRMRQAISCLSRSASPSDGEFLSLRIAAVDLASLLVQLAANAAASGRACAAPEERSAAVDRKLGAVTGELAARAQEVERPEDNRGDVVAYHLAAGLRVCASQETLQALSAVRSDHRTESTAVLRGAWVRLATNEYAAVAALNADLDRPTYDERFGSLSTAIAEGAASVICGARLIGRPDAFRHRRAWRQQAVVLRCALEAYVAGLRGDPTSVAHAQLITLTRLWRATVAIALIDLGRADALPINGSSKR